jgi:hypothetical protein
MRSMLFHSLGGKVDEIITIFFPTWEVTDGIKFYCGSYCVLVQAVC